MKTFVLFLFSSLFVLHARGQLSPTVTPVIDQFGIIKSLNSKPGNVKGTVYLNEEWINSNIYVKQGAFSWDKIENVSIKLDLMTNTIELRTHYGIKVLDNSKVDRFEWIDPTNNAPEVYSNCNQFTLNGTKLEGFCTIYGNNVRLVKHHYIDILKADYNVALHVGSKEDRIIKKSKFYLVKADALIECTKKSVYAVMADKGDKIKQFVKKNHVNFSEERDLRSAIDYYNSF